MMRPLLRTKAPIQKHKAPLLFCEISGHNFDKAVKIGINSVLPLKNQKCTFLLFPPP